MKRLLNLKWPALLVSVLVVVAVGIAYAVEIQRSVAGALVVGRVETAEETILVYSQITPTTSDLTELNFGTADVTAFGLFRQRPSILVYVENGGDVAFALGVEVRDVRINGTPVGDALALDIGRIPAPTPIPVPTPTPTPAPTPGVIPSPPNVFGGKVFFAGSPAPDRVEIFLRVGDYQSNVARPGFAPHERPIVLTSNGEYSTLKAQPPGESYFGKQITFHATTGFGDVQGVEKDVLVSGLRLVNGFDLHFPTAPPGNPTPATAPTLIPTTTLPYFEVLTTTTATPTPRPPLPIIAVIRPGQVVGFQVGLRFLKSPAELGVKTDDQITFTAVFRASGPVSPVPTSTPVPTAAPTPTATPVPTDTPAPQFTIKNLPSMILSLTDVQNAFPGFAVNVGSSGYEDNDQSAEGSIDPADTGADLAARDRIVGYKVDFTDLEDDLSPSVSSSVDLFDSPESATAFLQGQIADFEKFEGTDLAEGVNFKEFVKTSAPSLGSDAVAGRLTVFVQAFSLSIVQTFVSWRRGPTVAAVLVVANDTRDRSAIASFLARQMDAQINKALAGELGVTPVPSPTPMPVLTSEQAALQQGYDLSKMLPTLDDLVNAKVVSQGYQEDSSVVASYRRAFQASEGVVLDLGSSKLIHLVATVALQDSTGKATGFVSSQDPTDLSKLLAPSFGVGPDKIAMNPLTVPKIGDAVVSFGMRIETSSGTLDGVILFFARGRVNATLLAIGPALLVVGDDLVPLGQLVDQRVQANSP